MSIQNNKQLLNHLNKLDPTFQNYKTIEGDYPAYATYNKVKNLITEVKKLEREYENAGFFGKRGARKRYEAKLEVLKKEIQSLNIEIAEELKTLLNRLQSHVPKIREFNKKKAEELRSISFPLNVNTESLNKLSEDLVNSYKSITQILAQKDNVLKLRIMDKIEKFSPFIEIDRSNYSTALSHSASDIELMNLDKLLEVHDALQEELNNLQEKLTGIEKTIEVHIQTRIQELNSTIEKSSSLNIEGIEEFKDELQVLKQKLAKTETTDALLQLTNQLNNVSERFTNTLRQHAIDIRNQCQSVISKVTHIYSEEYAKKWFPQEPDIVLDSIQQDEVLSSVEKLSTWKQDIFKILRVNIIDHEEMINILKTLDDLDFEYPKDVKQISQEKYAEVQESSTLKDAIEAIIEYDDKVRSTIRDAIRDKIVDMLKLPLDEVTHDIPTPQVNLKTNNPKEMLNYYQASKEWFTKVSKGLRETHIKISNSLNKIRELRQQGLNTVKDDYIENLERLRKESKNTNSIQRLSDLRKQYIIEIEEVTSNLQFYIKDTLNNVLIERLYQNTTSLPEKPEFGSLENLAFDALYDKFERLKNWQRSILENLINDLRSKTYPKIQEDTSLDLKDNKKETITALDDAQSFKFKAAIKKYLSFKDLERSTKTLLLQEMTEMVQKTKHEETKFKKLTSIAPRVNLPSALSNINDLRDRDYSLLLELWSKGKAFRRSFSEHIKSQAIAYFEDKKKEFTDTPKNYANHFEDVCQIFNKAIEEIKETNSTPRIFDLIDNYNSNATYAATTHLERVRGQIYNHLMVTFPKVREALEQDIPADITQRTNELGSAPKQYKDLDAVIRTIQELLHIFLYEIIEDIQKLLTIETKSILNTVTQLKEAGINIYPIIKLPLERLSQLLTTGEELLEINEIRDGFTQVVEIKNNEEATSKIKEGIINKIREGQKTFSLITTIGQIEDSETLDQYHLDLEEFEGQLATTSGLKNLADLYLSVYRTCLRLKDEIIRIETRSFRNLEQRYKDKYPYYKTYLAIFREDLDETSDNIFPYKGWMETRHELKNLKDLSKAPDILQQLFKYRKQWEQEVLPKLTKWHRILPIIISMFDPNKDEESLSQHTIELENKIMTVYKPQDMKTYLLYGLKVYTKKFLEKQNNKE